ncbi:carbohydrate kinase [Apibacter muscae]|uniref:Carbohydrate kinase n=1 Tax=Apibacter muscae TaxID=2509004 RepID=A0A563DIN2_9FLAO|nr:carbohydrate kinase [Apibacter muscae]TWP29871.1 carbohydrate kinase [Apibacter muscae]
MEREIDTRPIVSFGEILWDIFESGKKIGGAPFNVAYHINKMGATGKMISCVGKDELGAELLGKVKEANISTDYCQVTQEQETGTVLAEIDENNEAHYTIKEPVAWDFIQWEDSYKELLRNSQALVFGSLGSRNSTSKETLHKLIEIAPYKVFDVNLRPPFIFQDNILKLLEKSDLVKMNKSELRQVLQWLGEEYTSEESAIKYIRNHFNLDGLIVTKGSKGAVYCDHKEYLFLKAVEVEIKDTVGSGDSFLAGFLSKRAKGATVEEAMKEAVYLGAFITNHQGACPEYSIEEFEKFKQDREIG